MKSNLKTRDDFPELLNKLNLKELGVEVGVQEGFFSEIIRRPIQGFDDIPFLFFTHRPC